MIMKFNFVCQETRAAEFRPCGLFDRPLINMIHLISDNDGGFPKNQKAPPRFRGNAFPLKLHAYCNLKLNHSVA